MNKYIFFNQKIKEEKRRRTQIYKTLDYFLSNLTYFDFFSQDAFLIIKHAKFLALEFNMKFISNEILLLTFLDSKNELANLLQSFLINEKKFHELLSLNKKTKGISFSLKNFFLSNLFNSQKEKVEGKFSYELQTIFEKASENAFMRFKTPVISSEILFLTLMEEKSTKVSKIIRQLMNHQSDWYLLRYELIKRIHSQESSIRGDVSINQQFFAYLLKTKLSENQYNSLIENKSLELGVSIFRNILISTLLNQNIFDLLIKDVKKSMKLTAIRRYSS